MAPKNKSENFCDTDFNLARINNSTKEDNPDADDVGAQEMENRFRQEELNKLKDDRSLRKKYANKVFIFISIWSVGLFLILLLSGFGTISLGDSVLITLLATSFIEVLGLFYYVMKYLFAIDNHELDEKVNKKLIPRKILYTTKCF